MAHGIGLFCFAYFWFSKSAVKIWFAYTILALGLQYRTSEDGSRKDEILKELTETTRHRKHLDTSVELIGTVLFGPTTNFLNLVREPDLPLVDDWECLKSVVRVSQSLKFYLTHNNVKGVGYKMYLELRRYVYLKCIVDH